LLAQERGLRDAVFCVERDSKVEDCGSEGHAAELEQFVLTSWIVICAVKDVATYKAGGEAHGGGVAMCRDVVVDEDCALHQGQWLAKMI
jgi:hypothetical protein